jgi:hypothetical protein
VLFIWYSSPERSGPMVPSEEPAPYARFLSELPVKENLNSRRTPHPVKGFDVTYL